MCSSFSPWMHEFWHMLNLCSTSYYLNQAGFFHQQQLLGLAAVCYNDLGGRLVWGLQGKSHTEIKPYSVPVKSVNHQFYTHTLKQTLWFSILVLNTFWGSTLDLSAVCRGLLFLQLTPSTVVSVHIPKPSKCVGSSKRMGWKPLRQHKSPSMIMFFGCLEHVCECACNPGRWKLYPCILRHAVRVGGKGIFA